MSKWFPSDNIRILRDVSPPGPVDPRVPHRWVKTDPDIIHLSWREEHWNTKTRHITCVDMTFGEGCYDLAIETRPANCVLCLAEKPL